MTTLKCRVAIVGAGPYGLAMAAHLRAENVETCVFGEVMAFWGRQMPIGMLLRSPWEGSHISDPGRALTLDAYQATHRVQLSTPVPLDDFIRYGQWFQHQVVPDLDQRRVICIAPASGGFRLVLEDGESLQAQRVVVAVGIASFAWRPPQFDALPPALASHSSKHHDLNLFAGQRVIVVGGGQSAIESAALLHETGADVEVVVRAPGVRWLNQHGSWLKSQANPARRLLYPPSDIGPPGLNWVIDTPDLFRRLPLELQDRIARRAIRPAGADWLRPRMEGVPITTSRNVVSTMPIGERLQLVLDDGTQRRADHVILATGYRVDVSRYPFLATELRRAICCVDGYPKLAYGFESSVPGLHFVGAPAAMSFGPLCRFVAGTHYTARALTRCILGKVPAQAKRQGAYA